MNWTALAWAVGGGFVTLVILVALNYRPSQIRRDRMLRHEARGVRSAVHHDHHNDDDGRDSA